MVVVFTFDLKFIFLSSLSAGIIGFRAAVIPTTTVVAAAADS
jgi:hypothetical protein